MAPRNAATQDTPDEGVLELIRRARQGDVEAFKGLYDRYATRLLNFAYKMLNNREEAEDVTQETFTAVFRKFESLQHDAKFEAWLFRIGRNFIYQRYRTRALEPIALETEEEQEDELSGLADSGKSPEEVLLAGELRDVVAELISSLPDKYREVFVLSAIHRFSYQDIAEILGRSLPSVKTDIHRARLEVRGRIKQYLGIPTDDPM